MTLNQIKDLWGTLNKIHPETRSLIIILLFGWILYSQITGETGRLIKDRVEQEIVHNKKAEQYSMETAIEINQQIQLIAEIDKDAFDVLLLNYHNNTQSLQGYKYLYLSCLTEAPRTLDTPTLQQQWNKLDYIYYADELAKIHSQSFVTFSNVEDMGAALPKLYRLVKASDAKSISFFTIEGHQNQIGLVVALYKEPRHYDYKYAGQILHHIQKLALILDYDKAIK